MASSMVKIGPWQSLHQWCRKRRNRMTWICCQKWYCLMMGVLLISWERDWAQTHPVIQGSFWFCCVSEDFWLLNLWSMFVNLFKWLLLKAFQAICLFMFLHFLQNVPSPRDQLGNWKRAQLVKMYSSGCQPLTTCNLPKKEAFANGTWGWPKLPEVPLGLWHLLVHKASWNAWKTRSTLETMETSTVHPSFLIQKTSESNLKWRLLVDFYMILYICHLWMLLLAEMDLMVCFSHLFLVNSLDRGPRFLGPSFSAIQNSLAVWPPRARCQGGETGSCRWSVLIDHLKLVRSHCLCKGCDVRVFVHTYLI